MLALSDGVLPRTLRICVASTPEAHNLQQQSDLNQLAAGTRIERDFIAPGGDTFTVNLKAGQFLRLTLESRGFDLEGQLSGGGTPLKFHCRERRQMPLSLIAERDGVYRVSLRSVADSEQGGYVLQVVSLRKATAVDSRLLLADRTFLEGELLGRDWSAASWRKAVPKYEKARLIYQSLNDQNHELRVLRQLAAFSYSLNDPHKALRYYEAALLLTEATGDHRSRCEILSESGHVYLWFGENQRALNAATTALEIARKLSSRYHEAQVLDLIGEAYSGFGNVREALRSYQQLLSIRQELKDRRGQALALLHLGYAYSDLSETDKALDSYRKALALWQKSNDPRGEGLTFTALGHLHSKLGNKQEALDMYSRASALLEALDDRVALASIANGIGYVLEELGQTRNALQKFLHALELFQSVKHRIGEAGALYKVGKTYFALGQNDESLKYYERSRAVSHALGNKRMEAVSTGLIGRVYLAMGKPQAALESYEAARLLNESGDDRRELAHTLNSIGAIYQQLGQSDLAETYFTRALELNQLTGDRFGESSTLFSIARLLHEKEETQQAKTQIEAALRITESLRMNVASQDFRSSYVGSIHQQFELYVEVLMKLHRQFPDAGWDAAALEASERGRARSLLDTIGESRDESHANIDRSLIEQEQSLRSQLDELAARQLNLRKRADSAGEQKTVANEIARLSASYAEVESRIRASGSYKSLAASPVLKASEIQGLLDPGTAMLEFALGEQRSFLWVITATAVHSFELPAESEIETLGGKAYEALTARNLQLQGETFLQKSAREARADVDYESKALALSGMLLKPAWPLLKNRRLVIIADGILQIIPFAALPNPERVGEPLIMDQEIVVLPSASVLAAQRHLLLGREPASLGLAIFADPVFDAQDPRVGSVAARSSTKERNERKPAFDAARLEVGQALRDVGLNAEGRIPRLYFSLREAEAILGVTQAARPLEALGFQANRKLATQANLSQYRYLHFATHGLINNEHPELSGILLSMVDEKGRPQNGFLKLTEISRLNLRADLLVLSACQTALGKEIRGEGLMSLTRGFMNAGAARVVASLWKVDDVATAELMSQFYREMFINGKAASAALRAAQIHVSKQKRWRTAYYWAAFVLQGEWR